MASTSYVNGTAVNGVAGPSNGHATAHSLPSPLSLAQSNHVQHPPYRHSAQTIAASHNVAIVNHLADAGFRSGHYSDITVTVPWRSYGLHRLVISRSPYLAHVMGTEPSSKVITLPLEQEPSVTPEAFDIALSYLYSPASLEAIHPHNARSVLAAACLLGGMDELTNYAYQMALASLSVETIMDWLDFLDALPSDSEGTIFGAYAKQMREDVFHFLVVSLPVSLGVVTSGEVTSPVTPSINTTGADLSGQEALLQVYARLPFDLFKRALESPQFPLYAPQARFKFAKRAIELRKSRGTTKEYEEETVVLAFGTGDGSATPVHVTRRTKKRAFFKVGR